MAGKLTPILYTVEPILDLRGFRHEHNEASVYLTSA